MRRLVTDTLVIAERNLLRLPRAPELLLAFTITVKLFKSKGPSRVKHPYI